MPRFFSLEELNGPLTVASGAHCGYCGLPGHTEHCDCGRPQPCACTPTVASSPLELANAVKFACDLMPGDRVRVNGGTATITAINRDAGTITCESAWEQLELPFNKPRAPYGARARWDRLEAQDWAAIDRLAERVEQRNRVYSFGNDLGLLDELTTESDRLGLYGIKRATDVTRLAGIRVSTMDEILKKLYPADEIRTLLEESCPPRFAYLGNLDVDQPGFNIRLDLV